MHARSTPRPMMRRVNTSMTTSTQVDGEDEEFAHGTNRTKTTSARKTAPQRRVPSYYEFATDKFQAALAAYGMRSSMSRKGDCWDNAPTESLWGSLKVARLHGKRFATRRAAMDEVIDWMGFYNHRRLHSTLAYLSPMQFEQRWRADQEKRAA
jgi:transposase InsO family protein